MTTSCARPLRCTLVWCASTAVSALAIAALRADALALAGGAGSDLEEALVRCGSVLLLGCTAWSWLATSAVLVQAARGRAGHPVPGVPAPWRRLVLLACGASLVVGLAGPATADPGLSGLPLPDRADGPAAPARPAPPVVVESRTVTVRPDDSLWSLAAAELGPDASPARIERHWRDLYELNRPVVGPDPDLIHPGQQLRLPAPPQETP